MASSPETADPSSLDPCKLYARTEPISTLPTYPARTAGFFGELSSDPFGGLFVTQHASILGKDIAFTVTAGAYQVGHVIGGLVSVGPVNRGNTMGSVIETLSLIYTANVAAASLPDIDVWVFRRAAAFEGSNTFTDNAFPSVAAHDTIEIAGSIPIRVGSGHWRQMLSAAGTVQRSVATVNPFLSFTTDNADSTTSNIGILMITQTAFTPSAINSFKMNLTIRKG